MPAMTACVPCSDAPDRSWKARMMPRTVPNSPTKGALLPSVPRNARRLRFYWRKVGRVVSLPVVHHPGQRGKNYLLQAAQSVARRHNMLIIIRDI